MSFTDFLIFSTASVGMTLIVVYGKIFKPLREYVAASAEKYPKSFSHLKELLNCVQCAGFWSGVVCAVPFTFNPFLIFLCGCSASFLSMLADNYLAFLKTVSGRVTQRPPVNGPQNQNDTN